MSDPTLIVTANSIGKKFADDPELNLPVLPYFPPEILVVPYGSNGLMFEGAQGQQVLKGISARRFVPTLLPLLDGTNDLLALQHHFPKMSEASLINALTLLYTRGLLSDGKPSSVDSSLKSLAQFSDRYNDVTRANVNSSSALKRLYDSKIAVVGNSMFKTTILSAMKNLGLDCVDYIDDPKKLVNHYDLIIACFSGDDSLANQWCGQAYETNTMVLHAHMGDDEVEIGPLFIPGKTACYSCFRQFKSQPLGNGGIDSKLWASVIALSAFHLISRIGPTKLYNTCRIHRRIKNGKLYEKVKITRLPGCSHCGLEKAKPVNDGITKDIWRLHTAAHGMICKDLRSIKDHQSHYAAVNVGITETIPSEYYGSNRLPLPDGLKIDVTPLWQNKGHKESLLDKYSLATILRYSAGYQENLGLLRRIAPSAGGLGCAELYIVARDINDLDNGIYRYYGLKHELELVAGIDDELLAGALGLVAGQLPAVVIIGVSNLTPIRQKYDKFVFRLATLDSGVCRNYIHETSIAQNLKVAEYTDARDKILAHMLNLPHHGNSHSVCFSVGIDNESSIESEVDIYNHHYHYPDALIELSAVPSHRKTLLQYRRKNWYTELSGVEDKKDNLGRLLLRRRSIRHFSDKKIDANLLNTIIGLMVRLNEERIYYGAADIPFKIYVSIKSEIHGQSKIYYWNDVNSELVIVQESITDLELSSTMLQPGFSQAPAVLFITADFESTVSRLGGWGYREMLSRAGAMMSRGLIVAESFDLSGCMWGGLSEEMWGEKFKIDRYLDCPIFGCALGYENNE